jgi:peptidoglycan/xylan/chitin deacetylase (PgdA/CDA1 family)
MARHGHRHGYLQLVTLAVALVMAGCGQGPAASAWPAQTPRSSVPSAAPTASFAPTATPSHVGPPSPSATATARATPVPTARPTPPPTAKPTPRPTPITTPRPTPRPTARPTPPVPPASTLVQHGPRTTDRIALTFDMGGRVGDALRIVDWLVGHDVHATIFMTGAMAANRNTDAGRRVLTVIEANPGLLTLGNHSYTHRDFRTLTSTEIREELRRTEEAIAPSCSQDPRPFFRPPSGGYDADALGAIGAAGYRYTVTWDVDTIDWRPIVNDPPGPTADQIVSKVLGRAQAGSIVLMHLGGYETFEALPRIVGGLEAAGYDLVTLDTLMGT